MSDRRSFLKALIGGMTTASKSAEVVAKVGVSEVFAVPAASNLFQVPLLRHGLSRAFSFLLSKAANTLIHESGIITITVGGDEVFFVDGKEMVYGNEDIAENFYSYNWLGPHCTKNLSLSINRLVDKYGAKVALDVALSTFKSFKWGGFSRTSADQFSQLVKHLIANGRESEAAVFTNVLANTQEFFSKHTYEMLTFRDDDGLRAAACTLDELPRVVSKQVEQMVDVLAKIVPPQPRVLKEKVKLDKTVGDVMRRRDLSNKECKDRVKQVVRSLRLAPRTKLRRLERNAKQVAALHSARESLLTAAFEYRSEQLHASGPFSYWRAEWCLRVAKHVDTAMQEVCAQLP